MSVFDALISYVGVDVYLTLSQPKIEVKGDSLTPPPPPPPGWVGSVDGNPFGRWVGLVFTNINAPPHPLPQKAGVQLSLGMDLQQNKSKFNVNYMGAMQNCLKKGLEERGAWRCEWCPPGKLGPGDLASAHADAQQIHSVPELYHDHIDQYLRCNIIFFHL
jgi:hypothetical protein